MSELAPTIELVATTLHQRPAYSWRVYDHGRLVGFGIESSREQALACALKVVPRADPPEGEPYPMPQTGTEKVSKT